MILQEKLINNSNIIKINNISLKIKDKIIVENITFALDKGKITTLIGPNGGGKTSLAKIILGLIKPTTGKLEMINSLKIGYVPQKVNINKIIPLSALDFIALMSNIDKKILIKNQNFQQLVARMNLTRFLDDSLHNLSGGQLQKLILIQSLINPCDLLVLDEPTQYMDIESINQFYQIIIDIKEKYNSAILLISHDLHSVMQKTDYVICVNRHICCSGIPESINNHPEYLALFGKYNNLSDNINNLAIYQHHHDHNH